MSCTNCAATHVPGQWWSLRHYFGIDGKFCPACYELVSHDPFDTPRHPAEYETIKAKQRVTAELKAKP